MVVLGVGMLRVNVCYGMFCFVLFCFVCRKKGPSLVFREFGKVSDYGGMTRKSEGIYKGESALYSRC